LIHSKRNAKYKERLLHLYGGICFYCLEEVSPKKVTVDHVIPESEGGGSFLMNLLPACNACNQRRKTIPFLDFITPHTELYVKYCQDLFPQIEVSNNLRKIMKSLEAIRVAQVNHETALSSVRRKDLLSISNLSISDVEAILPSEYVGVKDGLTKVSQYVESLTTIYEQRIEEYGGIIFKRTEADLS
jgi:hypothetical protein